MGLEDDVSVPARGMCCDSGLMVERGLKTFPSPRGVCVVIWKIMEFVILFIVSVPARGVCCDAVKRFPIGRLAFPSPQRVCVVMS